MCNTVAEINDGLAIYFRHALNGSDRNLPLQNFRDWFLWSRVQHFFFPFRCDTQFPMYGNFDASVWAIVSPSLAYLNSWDWKSL